MCNFSELDTLTNRLIDEEIGTYDLPYYIEALLEGATLIDLLKAYLNDAITHKNASRIECVIILAGALGEDKKAVVTIRKVAFGRLASQSRRSCGYN